MTRITLTIDRIVTDGPGIDRAALERALRAELARRLASEGAAAFGGGGSQPVVRQALPPSANPLATRIAAAAVGAATTKAGRP